MFHGQKPKKNVLSVGSLGSVLSKPKTNKQKTRNISSASVCGLLRGQLGSELFVLTARSAMES